MNKQYMVAFDPAFKSDESYKVQLDDVIAMSKNLNNCPIVMDAVGIGSVMYEQLLEKGLNIIKKEELFRNGST